MIIPLMIVQTANPMEEEWHLESVLVQSHNAGC